METIRKIDIHAHSTAFPQYYPPFYWSTPENPSRFISVQELLPHYDNLNIEMGVLLPLVSSEGQSAPMTSESCKFLADQHPDRFIWFCNVDPRVGANKKNFDLSFYLNHYKSLGAKGLGELTSQFYADDPMIDNLFYHCAQCDLPVTIHISPEFGNGYGLVDELGLPRIEKMLKKHKDLKLIGHSQPFWAEISGDLTLEKRNSYPTGKVTEGTLSRLMREYGNLYCDLSAGSGANAMMRDPEFAARFMEEFSDRILYGCDICEKSNSHPYKFDAFLDQMRTDGMLSQETYYKFVRGNAIKLLKLQESN